MEDDDEAARAWLTDDQTQVELDPSDLEEFEQDERTPIKPPSFLHGYELGRRDERLEFFHKWEALLASERRMGMAIVLQKLRDQLIREGNSDEVVEHIVGRLAEAAGLIPG